MKVEYDREADILYIKLRDSKIVDTRLLGEDVYVDMGEDGNFVGIEIWKASQNAILPISKDIAEQVKAILERPAWKKGNIRVFALNYHNLSQLLKVNVFCREDFCCAWDSA